MSKRGDWIGYASFAGGERSDLPPHLIPEDALLKANNAVMSKTGRISRRGPVQPYLLTAVSDTLEQLAQYDLTSYSPTQRGFALGKSSAGTRGWYTFNLANYSTYTRAGSLSARNAFSGANASQNSAFAYRTPTGATPPSFNYFGLPFFPSGTNAYSGDAFFGFSGNPSWAGQPNLTVVSGTVSITAGDPEFLVPGAVLPGTNAANYPGNFIYVYLPSATASARQLYIGVVISATAVGADTFLTVFPTPQKALSGTCYVGISPYVSGPMASRKSDATTLYVANAFPPTEIPASVPTEVITACSHQNRIVCAPRRIQKITVMGASILPTATYTEDAVIQWSAIAGEPATASSTNADGLLPLQIGGWPTSQSVTLETSGIVSLISMDANNLMVLCKDKTIMLSGTLGTVLPAINKNTSSFNVRTVAQQVGCLDALSVQRTPVGIMFASRDGVYVTDGTTFKNVMEGKVQTKWNSFVDSFASTSSTGITGSAFIGDTHYVVFTNGTSFVCDVYNDFACTTMTIGNAYSGANDIVSYGYGIADYRGRSEVYAPKVCSVQDTSSTCDKIVLVDSILLTDGNITTSVPSGGTTTNEEFAYSVDAGSAVPMNAELWTRAYTFGDPSTLKAYKTMTATFRADAKVDTTDPLNIYYDEGLETTVSYTTAYATEPASPSGDTAAMRVSFTPRIIDNGVSFGFKTNYVRTDFSGALKCVFSLYEIALNFVGLRKGRTTQ